MLTWEELLERAEGYGFERCNCGCGRYGVWEFFGCLFSSWCLPRFELNAAGRRSLDAQAAAAVRA